MNRALELVVAFAAVLFLVAPVASQDTVSQIPLDGSQLVVHHGKITWIDLDGAMIRIKTDTGWVSLKFDEVKSIETTNEDMQRKWDEVLRQRNGEGGNDQRRGPIIRGGENDLSSEALNPSREEEAEIQSLVKYLGYTASAEDELVAYGRKATEQVMSAVDNHNDEMREAACRVLSRLNDARSIKVLIERVDDKFDGVRVQAVRALAQFSDREPAIVDVLLKRARQEEVVGVMKEIVTVLGPLGANNSKLRKAVLNDSYAARETMISYYYACLAMMGDVESSEKLKTHLQRSPPDDLFMARALSASDRDAALSYLIRKLKSTRGEVRQEDEITSTLREITGISFGYREAESLPTKEAALAAKEAAKAAWIQWFEDPARERGDAVDDSGNR